ncbi:MAG: TIGR02301 family protein [Hyphomonadaceae bacterium]
MLHTPAHFRHYRQIMKFTALAGALALSAAALPAAAQQTRGQQPQQQTEAPPAGGEEWYRGQLVELSEVLGGAHYLRIVCDGRGDQRWRDYMRGVIQREPRYNGLLVEGFNRGYRNEEARFPVCDATTRQMEAELRARGLRVAQALSARHAD